VTKTPAPAIRDAIGMLVRSRVCQAAGVALAFLVIAALHRQNDGLWFQGDSPRHAMNGLFWWDLLTTLPRDPVEFAVSYYARYPAISPATYPPLFYFVEGLTFAAFGPSPQVAKLIVLLFGVMAGVYTMAWARRWIGPVAGWAGPFLAFVPGIVMWTNSVMLNIPAAALGLAVLYHFRRWSETARVTQLVLTLAFAAAVVLTYYQGGIVLCVCAGWAVLRWRAFRVDRRVLWIAAGAVCAIAPVAIAMALAPVQTARHLPTLALLTRSSTWTFYWIALPDVTGRPALVAGVAGLIAGFFTARWRTDAAYLAIWITALIVGLSLLPAKDPRYVLLAVPAFILAAAIGLAAAVPHLRMRRPEWQAAALAAGLAAGFWSAARVQVPQVSGFREIATYLREQAPREAVLYDGLYDGLFGFYVRAFDPDFERRVALGNKLLYQDGPASTFMPVQKSNVASTQDVVNLLRTRSGCRWVAIEVTRSPGSIGRRLLREAVARPEFELVRSFPITGAGERRVDLYRIVGAVDPIATVDLGFPSFTNRTFSGVVPITR
jgi:hypothetical protein